MARSLIQKLLRALAAGGVPALLVATSLSGTVVAQEAIALAIDGWTTKSGADGIATYRCASAVCAASSVVSYKEQPHHAVTLEEFERHHRRLAQENKGTGRIRDVRIEAPQQRDVDGVRVLQISRAVDWDDGTTTHTIEARLIGPERSYSLVSDSPRAEWTTNNFEGFLRRLVDIAGITGR